MSERDENRARAIVQKLLYVTIATVSAEGEPCNSPVYSAYDNDANFYWTSSPQAEHSRNIEENGKVFLAIYDSSVPEGTGEGVYIQAIAAPLKAPAEIEEAKLSLARRVNKQLGPRDDHLLKTAIQRIYRATPRRAWVNGFEVDEEGRYLRDIRVEVRVASLKGLVTW